MVDLFPKNLMTPLTNTLIKKYSKIKDQHSSYSKKTSLAKSHFLRESDITFCGCEPFPYVIFCYIFCQPSLFFFLSDACLEWSHTFFIS